MTIRELRRRHERARAEMRAILEKAGDNDLSDEQRSEFDRLKAEIESIEAQISRQEFVDEAERRANGERISGTGDDRLDIELRNFSILRGIAAHVPGVAGNIDAGREIEIQAELSRRYGIKSKGVLVPTQVFEKRVLTSSTPVGGPGSNLIATDHLGAQFIDTLRARMVTATRGARILTGLSGNVAIPKRTASSNAQWVAENAPITASDPEFGQVDMAPKHVGAITELSRNMLLQTSPDAEQLVRDDFAIVLAEAIDRAAINGGGLNEPDGILQTAGIGSVSMATPTWEKVLEFIETLEIANAMGGGWATHPSVVKALRSTNKVAAEPDHGFIMDGPSDLAGYPLTGSTLVPSTLGGGSDKALIFGDWSDLVIGSWGVFEVLINPFESNSYARGNVQVRAMMTTDVAVRRPQSFAAATDIA